MNNFKNTKDIIIHTKKYVNGKTLDFGAGTAKYQHFLRPHALEYVTFDMVPGDAIDVVGDVLNPPFENETFDTVVSTQVLEHVERPWIMVAQIGRITKKGGICIATAPFLIPYHADPYDFFRYTKQGLESLFTHEGFEVVESGTYGKTFGVLSEMIHFTLFSPYEVHGKKIWSRRIMRYVERACYFLDRFVSTQVVYPNVYLVMRKK